MPNDMELALILKAKDKMSGPIRGAVSKSDKEFDKMQKKIQGVSSSLDKIGKASMIAGGALIAASVVNLKNASEFQAGMSSVSTLIDTNIESMDRMNDSVLKIAKRTPVELGNLTNALYDIRSAGMSAEDQFNILERSAQLGVAGLGATSQAVDLVTSSINAFNLKGNEQNLIYDQIFKTVKTGKTTIAGLAQGFGAVAGTIAAAGIQIDDYLSTVAALTTTGQPAAQAHTQMKAAVAGLTRNTKEQQKIFAKLGAKDFNDLIQKSGGVVGAFEGINYVVSGNKAKLIELLGSIEAYNAVLSLTGRQNRAYKDTLDAMRYGVSEVDAAFAKKLAGTMAQEQRGKNLFQKISIEWGNDITPAYRRFLDVVEGIADKVDGMPPKVRKAMATTTLAIGVGLTAFGALALGVSATLKGVDALMNGYGKLITFIKGVKFAPVLRGINMMSTAFSGLGAAIGATPVGWIVAGAVLLAGTALVIRKYWAPITQLFKGIADGIKVSLAPAFKEIKNALKPLEPVFDEIGSALNKAAGAIAKFIKPVNTAGNSSYLLGVSIGKAIGAFLKIGASVAKFILFSNPLVKMLTLIAKNFDNIKEKVIGAAEKIKSLLPFIGATKGVTINTEAAGGPIPGQVDGSHKSGLDNVPYDGYHAILHKDERVLTADENKTLRKNNLSSVSPISVVYKPYINAGSLRDVKELETMLERHADKLITKLRLEQRRKEARAYAI